MSEQEIDKACAWIQAMSIEELAALWKWVVKLWAFKWDQEWNAKYGRGKR